jgi:hypothetical protein
VINQNYRLDDAISKITEDVRLWQTEKGVLEICKNTLVIPIRVRDQRRGYVFHGHGKLLLDTIVETDEGAIGKPVEKELSAPFLMLGNTEKIEQHSVTAGEEDLARMEYKDQQEFVTKAEDLCNQFFKQKKREMGDHQFFGEYSGSIFAFQNQTNELDILVTKGSKLVYKTKDVVFVSNKNKVVLKSPNEVICASNGKSVIIKN